MFTTANEIYSKNLDEGNIDEYDTTKQKKNKSSMKFNKTNKKRKESYWLGEHNMKNIDLKM